jgi:hypothetical protein
VAPRKVRDKLSLNEPEMQESVERSDLTKQNKAERRDERERIGLCKQCSLQLHFGILSKETSVDKNSKILFLLLLISLFLHNQMKNMFFSRYKFCILYIYIYMYCILMYVYSRTF